jgi:hypothetical protein
MGAEGAPGVGDRDVRTRGSDRPRSAFFGWRKIQQGAEGGPFFPHGQPPRRRVGLRQLLPVPDAPGLGPFVLGLLGDRRIPGQSIQVRDDPGQHPEHSGAVERDVLRRGIGLGPQVHHDRLPSLQAFQPLAAPAKDVDLARYAGMKVGVALRGGRLSIAPLTDPPRDLAGFFRAQELVDSARAEPRGRRDPADGQSRLMGVDDSPDPLALGLFQAFGGEAEPGGDLLFAANPLVQLVVGFHPSRLTISPVAVQQTGRLMACFRSNATRTPIQKNQLFHEPVTQGDCDAAADQLRHSGNRVKRERLVAIAKRKGFLLPAHFAADVSRARQAAGEVATFSATGDTPASMTEDRAELLASFGDGQALLAKQGLKANPSKLGDGDEDGGRLAANRLLARSSEGRAILKGRGFDSISIDRMQTPGY